MRGALVLVAVVLGACKTRPPAPAEPPRPQASARFAPADGLPGCRLYGEPRAVGRVPLALAELSGLAASARHPGVFWAHNDSGNAPVLFALDVTGKVLATVNLTGLGAGEARGAGMDLEDVAVGPCAPGEERPCVWLADTGDNFERRKQARLLRLPEPERVEDGSAAVEVLAFAWPDRPHDAEALVLEPGTGRPALLTKERDSLGELFVLEGLTPGGVGRATSLGTLRAPGNSDWRTTAAALHASGQRMLVRTYTRVWEVRQPGATRLEDLVRGQVVEVPGTSQAQAEALTWLPGERGYLLGSEFAGQVLSQVDCR